jgi:hypothetical protein
MKVYTGDTVFSTNKAITRDILRQNGQVLQDFINSEVYLYDGKFWKVNWVSKTSKDSIMDSGWFVSEMDANDLAYFYGEAVFTALCSVIRKITEAN